MNFPSPTATLVVFTRGAARDCSRRPLLPPHLRSLELDLRRRCLEGVLDAGRRLGLRLVVSSPDPVVLGDDVDVLPQVGSGFGDRLRATVRSIAAAGRGPLIVVGADTPGLTASHLESTVVALESDPHRVVLGPCPDGGFYLMGFTGSIDRELAEVPWCDHGTLESLLGALAATGRDTLQLPQLVDLDRRSDLETWLARAVPGHPWQRLIGRLERALAELGRPVCDPAPLTFSGVCMPPLPSRGPPGSAPNPR